MEFTLMPSVDDSKVLHGSLGHHLGAPIQTEVMQKQETYEIQQGQIHNPVHAIERCTQLYRLRLTLGRSSSAKDLGVPQTAVRILAALPSPPRSGCQRDCIWGQLALPCKPRHWAPISASYSPREGTTSPPRALTQLSMNHSMVLAARRNSSSWTVSASSTPTREGIVPLTPCPLTALKLCTLWNSRVHNWSVNWSEFSGGRPGWHWDRALHAPWGEAKGWDLQSGAAMFSGIETFHSSDIFKTKLSSVARMTMLWAAGWTDTS